MKAKKPKTRTALSWIGLWATVWWGVSCVYFLLLVWLGRDYYVGLSQSAGSAGFFSDWQSSINAAYHNYSFLPSLLALIIIVWAVGAWLWLKELKRQKISYKAAFKDLFLTIRR